MIDVDPKSPWPPKPYQPVQRAITEHDAWWSGDPQRLTSVYSEQPTSNGERKWRNRFWGNKADGTTPATRQRLHVPLPADIATTSADLLFSEPPKIDLPDADDTTVERLELATAGLHPTLLEAAEIQAALGGVFPRIVWDHNTADHPMFDMVHADQAVPEFRWGQLRAVTFWRRLDPPNSHEGGVWRYLERYEPGKISYGLFVGDETTIGRRTAFDAHPEVAWLATDERLAAGAERVLPAGLEGRLLAWYVPNMRPNRRHRALPVGRSDFQGVEAIFDALDETWTSWMRDLRLGRARILVPAEYVRSLGKGQGATFDLDQEVFVALEKFSPEDQAQTITENQFSIRVAEHAATAAGLVDLAVRTAGYAGRTFGIHTNDSGAATATEVHASERKSFVTRAKKANYWRPVLADMLDAWLAVDRVIFGSKVTPARPGVEFPDGVEEQPETAARTMQALRTAQAVSTDTLVRMLHPEWDQPAVEAEVGRILAEEGMQVSDPLDSASPDTVLP